MTVAAQPRTSAATGTPIDVAAAVVVFLASPVASFVNGTSILIGGGWGAQ